MRAMQISAIVLVFSSAGMLSAQTAPAITGPASEVQAAYTRFKDNILKAAEKMPAEDYSFKLTPEIRTFARVVDHVTEAQFHSCTALNGTAFDPKSVPGDAATKAEVIEGLKRSFAECDKAYGALTDANLAEKVKVGQNTRSRIGIAWGNLSHDNEQYAHMSLYLRGKGLVPPTGEK